MRLRAFELKEPVPELSNPHALAVVSSWIDAGNAASLTMAYLEETFGEHELANLAHPGEYFDFTRYRPELSVKNGLSELQIPNATVTYAKQGDGPDFIFLQLPEPHAMAEVYIDSVCELLKYFNVKRYGLLGSFYDMVPYTRPLLLSGTASNEALQNSLEVTQVIHNDYEGPTTILYNIGQQALQAGIETFSLLVHLPGYFTPSEDHRGVKRLLEAVCTLYGLQVPQEEIEKAKNQEEQFETTAEQFLQQQPHLKIILKQLEDNYDARVTRDKEEIQLSPEVEKFLKELNNRFGQG